MQTPLWLPLGSIRAIIALVLVVSSIALVFLAIGVPDWMALLIGVVVRDYFQSRADANDNGEPDDEEAPA